MESDKENNDGSALTKEGMEMEIIAGNMNRCYDDLPQLVRQDSEDFYNKLLALKKEQEAHLKLVEQIYINEKKELKSKPVSKPKGILKHRTDSENNHHSNVNDEKRVLTAARKKMSSSMSSIDCESCPSMRRSSYDSQPDGEGPTRISLENRPVTSPPDQPESSPERIQNYKKRSFSRQARIVRSRSSASLSRSSTSSSPDLNQMLSGLREFRHIFSGSESEKESVDTVASRQKRVALRSKRRPHSALPSSANRSRSSGRARVQSADSRHTVQSTQDHSESKLDKSVLKKFQPTIPEPFQMTVREELKVKERQEAIKLLGEVKLDDSKPKEVPIIRPPVREVPKNVQQNIYQEMVKKNQQRREKIREESKAKLLKILKPFSFVEREERKLTNLVKSESTPVLSTVGRRTDATFKAKPFPQQIFTNYADELLREREQYRKIQKKLRQEILMRQAAYPTRMESDIIKKQSQDEQKKKPKGIPMTRRERSDLDRLYREHREQLAVRQEKLERLAMEQLLQTRQVKLHQRNSRSSSRPASAERSKKRRPLSASWLDDKENMPLRRESNLTTQLRLKLLHEQKIREEKKRQEEEEKEKERKERDRRRREANPVWDNIRTDLYDVDEISIRKRERMDQEKARLRQYKRELGEMLARVERQPTLFQKQQQIQAAKSAERKYQQVLEKEGLKMADIQKYSSQESRNLDDFPAENLFPRTWQNGARLGIRDHSSYNHEDYMSQDVLEENHSEKEDMVSEHIEGQDHRLEEDD